MIEDIQLCLETAGIILTFTDFEILGIPGFETTVLYKGEATPYEVEKQNFAFQCSTIDIADNNVAIDDVFVMTDEVFEYSFKISRTPIPDLTGWTKIYADYVSKVLV